MAPQPRIPDVDGERAAVGEGCERLRHAVPRKQLRVKAPGDVAEVVDRLLEIGAEPLERRAILCVVELSAARPRWMRMASRRCCVLSWRLRSRRRRSVLPASTIRAREARSSPSRWPFSTASSVAAAAARTSSGSSVSAASIVIVATGRPSPVGRHRPPARPSWGRYDPGAVGIPEARGGDVPVADLQRRVIQRSGDAVAPLLQRRAGGESLEQPPQRRGGEQLSLPQGGEEPQREEDSRAHQHRSQGLLRGGVHLEDQAREVIGEEHREEQQRRRGDRDQRTLLGPGRGSHAAGVDDEHSDRHGKHAIRLAFPDPLHESGVRAELEHVFGTGRSARRKRVSAGDHG